MRPTLTVALLALLAGPAWADGDDHDHEHGEEAAALDDDEDEVHLSEIGGVRILHAWTRAGDGRAEVFMEIENAGAEEATLAAFGVEGAEALLVGTPLSGAGAPEPMGVFPLPPGVDLDLEPGGMHVEVTGMDTRAAGDIFGMHVTVEPFGEAHIDVEVLDADADRHPHAGHGH